MLPHENSSAISDMICFGKSSPKYISFIHKSRSKYYNYIWYFIFRYLYKYNPSHQSFYLRLTRGFKHHSSILRFWWFLFASEPSTDLDSIPLLLTTDNVLSVYHPCQNMFLGAYVKCIFYLLLVDITLNVFANESLCIKEYWHEYPPPSS